LFGGWFFFPPHRQPYGKRGKNAGGKGDRWGGLGGGGKPRQKKKEPGQKSFGTEHFVGPLFGNTTQVKTHFRGKGAGVFQKKKKRREVTQWDARKGHQTRRGKRDKKDLLQTGTKLFPISLTSHWWALRKKKKKGGGGGKIEKV